MPLFLNFRSLLHRHRRHPSGTAAIQDTSQLYNLPLYACSDSVVEVASDVMGSEASGTVRRDSPQPYQPLLYLDANVVEAICKTEIRDVSTQSRGIPPYWFQNSSSDLVKVASAVIDSDDESSTTQDWSLSDIIWSSDSDSDSEEVVPAVMKSEAVRLLAARIPPELFDDILFYVNVDRVSQRGDRLYRDIGNNLARNRGTPSPDDTLTYLKRCSFVCIFWANRCREHMFSGRTLQIESYEDAEIFRRYVVGGCPRLTPVHQLIKRIDVTHKYSEKWALCNNEKQTSFLHLLYLSAIQDKLKSFSIQGPVPYKFNHAKLDTPHWGIPPCTVVVPSSFLQNTITLQNVHLPSFYHIIKYIRHFSCAASITFVRITWDGQTPTYSLPHASNTIPCRRRPRSMATYARRGCTNSVHLALTVMMMNPNCPLHRLSDEERVWMIKSMTLLWGDKKDPDVRIGFDVSEQATTMRASVFHFVFEEASASTDRPDSVLSVVGMHAYISISLPANFNALVNHARTYPTIFTIVLLFDSFDILQETMKPFVEVLALATGTIELVLAYEMEEEVGAVGVGLATLEPNDRIYTWDDEQFEDYGGEDLSFHASTAAQEEEMDESTLNTLIPPHIACNIYRKAGHFS